MASSPSTVFLVLSLTLATVSVVVVSGAGEAPSPAPTGPLNLTEILTKAGHYNTFVRLLKDTEVTSQMDAQAQAELVLYHVLPRYYGFVTFETTTNPVRTQASGQRGVCTVNVTTAGEDRVRVSSGVVEAELGRPLRDGHPLAVYSLDAVLLPPDMFGPGAKKDLGGRRRARGGGEAREAADRVVVVGGGGA
ncbi:hypothetical protein OsJ_06412 [Oryza sativa Japonica Group]|uniref:Uncharacterized protein n=1 Tax=Oryza sativa subsp. japonica TaxID=39947 RepID=B9F586_ORYSJ|nr:hypothetical protein OsJ_06412 [Oryza sativa Japonica Group]